MNSCGLVWTVLLLALSPFARAQGAGANQGAAPSQAPVQAPSQADVAKYVQHLMALQVAFTNPPPQGVSIVAKEIARQGSSGQGLEVRYHIFIQGLPPDVLLTVSSLPVGAEQLAVGIKGISVGKDGVLTCAGRLPTQCGDAKKPDKPIDFVVKPAKGEPYRLIFDAGEKKVGLMIVPDPVEAKSERCTLRMVRLSPNFQFGFVSGEGFPPDTDVHYRFVSQGARDAVVHADAKGVIRTTMLAAGNEKNGGQASFEVLGKGCSPKVSYEWGTP